MRAMATCLLLLGDPRSDYYPRLRQILVYPDTFVARREQPLGNGLVQEQRLPMVGESWSQGQVILEAENTVNSEQDCTGHAETNLVRLASKQFDRQELASCTLVTSTEPCAMCAGAIHWSGIGRVIFGLAGETFPALPKRTVVMPNVALFFKNSIVPSAFERTGFITINSSFYCFLVILNL